MFVAAALLLLFLPRFSLTPLLVWFSRPKGGSVVVCVVVWRHGVGLRLRPRLAQETRTQHHIDTDLARVYLYYWYSSQRLPLARLRPEREREDLRASSQGEGWRNLNRVRPPVRSTFTFFLSPCTKSLAPAEHVCPK